MKSRQFCSVCKEWLDMEVVPTSDGDDDDGVIWFRCPQCQGFLPKLSGADLKGEDSATRAEVAESSDPADEPVTVTPASDEPPKPADADDSMPWDSPADMMAARDSQQTVSPPDAESVDPNVAEDGEPGEVVQVEDPLIGDDVSIAADKQASPTQKEDVAAEEISPEPILEYAAMLAEKDPTQAVAYRPWDSYEVGQCIHHLAWDDCGVVVAKEELPGQRRVIKVYFEEAGVVRLIESAPR